MALCTKQKNNPNRLIQWYKSALGAFNLIWNIFKKINVQRKSFTLFFFRHAHEVADILVNMSQGKTTHSNEDDRMSISSDRDSAVEPVEEAFVPKIARCSSKSNSAHTSLSGANIIVDAHVHVPEMVTNIYTDSLYPLDHSESTSQTQISAELLEQQANSVRTTTQEQTAPTPSQNSDQQSMSVGDLYNMGLPPEVIQMMERQQADLIMMENQATGEVVMYMVSRQTADIALPGAQSLQAAGLDPSHNIMRETLQQSLMTGQSQVHVQGMEALPGIVTQVANNCALHKTSAGAAAAFQSESTISPVVDQINLDGSENPVMENKLHVGIAGAKVQAEEGVDSKLKLGLCLALDKEQTNAGCVSTVNECKCDSSLGGLAREAKTDIHQHDKTHLIVSTSHLSSHDSKMCGSDLPSTDSPLEIKKSEPTVKMRVAVDVQSDNYVFVDKEERTVEVCRTRKEDVPENHAREKTALWQRTCTEFSQEEIT